MRQSSSSPESGPPANSFMAMKSSGVFLRARLAASARSIKAMTATSPLQYMKSLRLTQARQKLQAGGRVKAVAYDASYA